MLNFEQVRTIVNQWISEVVTHMTTLFPHVSPSTIEPVVREQITVAITESLAKKFAELTKPTV